MSKSPLIASVVMVVFLAGCGTTPPPPPEEVISSPAPSAGSSALNWSESNAAKPFPAARPIQPVTPVLRTNPPLFRPVTTWTSLNAWTAGNKLGPPRLISATPVASYAIRSANGTMVVVIGSREATWNGVSVQLGFAPELIDDQVFVHRLDLEKNLEPLLLDPPLTFGNRVIVIDPGHGGANSGTHSVVDGRLEKEFTLDWALRLAPLLATNGWKVFLTRTSDVTVSNLDRVVFAEQHHADLFISLHFNSGAPDDKPAGLETYCLTPTGMPSTLTRGWPDIWSEVLPNNAFDIQNLQLAMRLHTALLRATGEEDRGVCRARFIGVLQGQRRPAVLIEGGYLSNPREARRIENPEFRQKLAEAVAEALR